MANLGAALVDGTQYTITDGVVLRGGTQYPISHGIVLRGGTEYDIGDAPESGDSGGDTGGNVTVTVSNGFTTTSGTAFGGDTLCKGYVAYNSTQYGSGTFTVPAGSTITIYRKRGPKSNMGTGGVVQSYDVAYEYYENGVLKSTSMYTTSTTALTNTIAVTTNTTIAFLYRVVTSGGGSIVSPVNA